MSNNFVLLEKQPNGVAHLIINRPEVHNAFDDDVIEQLINQLQAVNEDSEIRVLVLRSTVRTSPLELIWPG